MSDLFNLPGRIIKTAMAIFGLDPQLPHDFVRASRPEYLPGKERPFDPPVAPFRAGSACRASDIGTVLHQENK
jgi:hypothetical protein